MEPQSLDGVLIASPLALTARGFAFRVVVHSPLDHQVELVATGLVGHRGTDVPLKGSLRHMDEALGHELSRWRAAPGPATTPGTVNVFEPTVGGPIQARTVLAIWLGMDDDIDVTRVGLAASKAVEAAVSRGALRIGFAPGLVDGSVSLPVVDIAQAVAIAAAETYARLTTAGALSFEMEVSPPRRDDAIRGARAGLASLEPISSTS
jgi:hypothetical protein